MRSLPRFGLLLALIAGLGWTSDGVAQKKKGKPDGKAKGDEIMRVDGKLTKADDKDKDKEKERGESKAR